MRSRRRHWLTGIAIFVALGLAATWFTGSHMMRAKTTPVARTAAEDVTLRTTDGVRIAASYWPAKGGGNSRFAPDMNSPAAGILILHGNDGSRDATAPNAAWLAEQGYAVLTIDFRGHGQSDRRQHSFGLNESRDARAAFDWLKHRQQGRPIAIVGISLGGAATLLGEGGPLRADALVLQAVYPDLRHAVRNRIASVAGALPAELLEPLLTYQTLPRFGVWPSRLAPIDAVRRYHGPLFVVGGGVDRFTTPEESLALYSAAPGPKSFWLAPGADHVAACLLSDAAYRARLLDFLRATIGEPRLPAPPPF